MPRFDYRCDNCQETTEVFRLMRDKSPQLCTKCGAEMVKAIVENTTGVNTGFGAVKELKETQYRRKRNAELGVRQIERYGAGASLVPNVNGVETGSWDEARRIAAAEGKSTKPFERLVEVEKRSANSRNIDEAKWKKAKDEAFKA